MTEKKLSYKEALLFAATAYIKNFKTFVLFFLINAGIFTLAIALFVLLINPVKITLLTSAGMFSFIELWNKTSNIFLFALFVIILYVIWLYYLYQVIKAGLRIYHNQAIAWRDYFSVEFSHFLAFVVALSWYILKVGLGFLLLVLPGIYAAVRYWFTGFHLVENEKSSVSEDIKYALQASENRFWSILGFSIILSLIARLSFFFFHPISVLASVHAYKQLTIPEQPQIAEQ